MSKIKNRALILPVQVGHRHLAASAAADRQYRGAKDRDKVAMGLYHLRHRIDYSNPARRLALLA